MCATFVCKIIVDILFLLVGFNLLGLHPSPLLPSFLPSLSLISQRKRLVKSPQISYEFFTVDTFPFPTVGIFSFDPHVNSHASAVLQPPTTSTTTTTNEIRMTTNNNSDYEPRVLTDVCIPAHFQTPQYPLSQCQLHGPNVLSFYAHTGTFSATHTQTNKQTFYTSATECVCRRTNYPLVVSAFQDGRITTIDILTQAQQLLTWPNRSVLPGMRVRVRHVQARVV